MELRRKDEHTIIQPNASMLPPLSQQRKPDVLDEDTYTEAISYIIERDFFPNLTKLKAQQQYLEAYDNGDVIALHRATRTLADLSHTPTLDRPGTTSQDSLISTPTTQDGKMQLELPSKVDLNLSLDQFQAKYTRFNALIDICIPICVNSEDNVSFAELIEKFNLRTREKYKWVFDNETRQLKLRGKEENSERNGTQSILSGKEEKTDIGSAKYQARNTLMVLVAILDGLPTESTSILNNDARGAPKAISHGNTRFDETEASVSTLKLPPSMEDAQHGVVTPWHDLKGIRVRTLFAERRGSMTPASSTGEEYGFVATTPSPNPSRMGTPLMTWGTIDGTPMLISGSETPGGTQLVE
ncbi:nuclear protein DGCR14 [Jimgerdemannia flammicorona]|uniref:Nuclear protein DGCR14 n=1 Tax=Jimgerdemannia flammicorona TaxID=994334 RepID=A0A433Q2I6_9FUNG|nr:nuclear protein DGCR14 [Jimgerdemannia flammicorona]